jgi:hypothetical protein
MRGAFCLGAGMSFGGWITEESRKEERVWVPVREGLFRRPLVTESEKETLDALGLEGGWRCLMDGGRLDRGVAKGSHYSCYGILIV